MPSFRDGPGPSQLQTGRAERISKLETFGSSGRIRTWNLSVYSAPRLAGRSASRAFGSFSGGAATHPSLRSLSVQWRSRKHGDHTETSRLRDNEIVMPPAHVFQGRIKRFRGDPMYFCSVVIRDESWRTREGPQLCLACAGCAGTEPGVCC